MPCLFFGFQDGEDEEFKDLTDEDDEECFMDADKEEDGVSVETEEAKPEASWVHHQNLEGLSSTLHYLNSPSHEHPFGFERDSLWISGCFIVGNKVQFVK